MTEYFAGVWQARYFWFHLAMSDLRSRWRRSFFGILWSILQPLGMTLLIVLVLSKLFNQEVRTFAPYILSGVIVWEFFSTALISGAISLVNAESYIKQTRHPLAIYTLRTCIAALTVMALASIALLGWILVALPENISITWIAVPTVFPIILLMLWPLSTIMGYVGSRYRDLPNALALILQAAWFVSPVYFPETMFRSGGLQGLIEYNPIYHLLQIVRAPLLQGEWPSATNYAWCLGTFLLCALLAIAVGKRSEKQVIFYL